MLQKIVNRILGPRHFWRTVSFDQLSELYVSMLLRSLAISLIGLFVPIYFYQIGYSVPQILGFFAMFFTVRIGFDLITAHIVARIGPKHTIALSTIGNICYLTLLLTLETVQWPLLLLACVASFTNSLFFVAFHTDFSKIKHVDHSGKEISYMLIVERLGGIIGPVLGGIIASVFTPEHTIGMALVLFAVSLVPLLLTNEPVRTHQHINFKGFPYRHHRRSFLAYACHNTENTITILLWIFFISLTVFTTDTYANVGIVVAIGTLVSLLSAKTIGLVIDGSRTKGLQLMKTSVLVNALIHLGRVWVVTPLHVVGINVLNEPVTLGYRMPFIKQFYAAADELPGYRIVYIALSESFSAVLRALVWGTLYLLSLQVSDPVVVIKFGFVLAALLSFGIMLQPQAYNEQQRQPQ